jgi:hypothetical protein
VTIAALPVSSSRAELADLLIVFIEELLLLSSLWVRGFGVPAVLTLARLET